MFAMMGDRNSDRFYTTRSLRSGAALKARWSTRRTRHTGESVF
jgi:hypothetical protein